VRFLDAGGTLVLTVSPDTVPEMIDAVLARAESDPAFSARVDDAVRTALTAKAHAGLLAEA
jgi:beta-N-acetylhexosaminidase